MADLSGVSDGLKSSRLLEEIAMLYRISVDGTEERIRQSSSQYTTRDSGKL